MIPQDVVQQASGIARHYIYPTSEVIAFDFDPGTTDISVDIVDSTAIIIPDSSADNQYEIELPTSDATTTINNGIVTIEVPN